MIYPLNAPMLDFLVLAVIAREDSYGYQISQQLKVITTMKDAALYPVLRRLQEGGYVETYDVQIQGRNRKYYKITEAGTARHQFFWKEWKAYQEAVAHIIGGIGHDEK